MLIRPYLSSLHPSLTLTIHPQMSVLNRLLHFIRGRLNKIRWE